MIKGTNTDCKITDISVVGSTATLTCLFFASDKTETPVGLRFLLSDADSDELIQIGNTTYWIDSINKNETNLLNANVNGYKEVRLNIDITKNNTASMQQSRWYRKCYLILTDITDAYNRPLWSSDVLDLVSENIELPQVKSISIYNKPVYVRTLNDYENRLFINFKYEYSSEIDFNYNNSNLKTYVVIKSISTGNTIEVIETDTTNTMKLESAVGYNYNEPILIEIYITNLKKEILKQLSFLYKPFVKKAYGYIKTPDGIKKIQRIIVKLENKFIVNPNNLAVKVNYTTPIYAHYDRYKYLKTVRNHDTHLDEQVEFHRCTLHIDTFITDTNFDNVVYSVIKNNDTVISQKTDEDDNTIILQDDSNERLNVEENVYKVSATYISEAHTKTTLFDNINKTIVCSPHLKVHRTLHPFNYENIFGQEENNNE